MSHSTGLVLVLYRTCSRFGTNFAGSSIPVTVNGFNPDLLGVYAGADNGKNMTLVVVNKDPTSPVSLKLSGLPTGNYFLRHFGGQAGIAKFQVSRSFEVYTASLSAFIITDHFQDRRFLVSCNTLIHSSLPSSHQLIFQYSVNRCKTVSLLFCTFFSWVSGVSKICRSLYIGRLHLSTSPMFSLHFEELHNCRCFICRFAWMIRFVVNLDV